MDAITVKLLYSGGSADLKVFAHHTIRDFLIDSEKKNIYVYLQEWGFKLYIYFGTVTEPNNTILQLRRDANFNTVVNSICNAVRLTNTNKHL